MVHFSKRSLEGNLTIDHRASPGLSSLPSFFEAPTKTCAHCGTIVIINPRRDRDREYCQKCDNYICDNCGLERKLPGYTHKTLIERLLNTNG